MKQLTIVVRPFKAEAVLKAINELDVIACSVQEAKGYSRQKGYLDRYLGSEYSMAFLPKVEISVWVSDQRAARWPTTLSRRRARGASATARSSSWKRAGRGRWSSKSREFNHRVTEDTEKRFLCFLGVLCDSVVRSALLKALRGQKNRN